MGEALQNHPALRNPSHQPHFFSPRFLLYQVSGCTKSNPGSDPHNWYCLTPIYWHGYMAQKTTVGFCRGSRVCPTEAIRNHAKKKQKTKKIHQIMSKPFNSKTMECWASLFVTWFTLIGVVVFFGLHEIAPNLCMTCHHKIIPYTFVCSLLDRRYDLLPDCTCVFLSFS